MSLLGKIFTAIRGGAREVGESIVDANALRIFEQEVNDAEAELEKAKRGLTTVMAKEMQAAREVGKLSKDIAKYEKYAGDALEKNDEALALEISEKVVSMHEEMEVQKKAQQSFQLHSDRMKELIKKSQKALADLERKLVMAKTTDSVHKATTAITKNYATNNSKLCKATDSLERIQKRQTDMEDKLAASDELIDDFSGEGLEKKLRAAGIGDQKESAQAFLDKLKAKKGS